MCISYAIRMSSWKVIETSLSNVTERDIVKESNMYIDRRRNMDMSIWETRHFRPQLFTRVAYSYCVYNYILQSALH